ncbi:Hsp70 protein [Kribbella sp. VKM Ac-2527]|uniref:Hsp70 protein n=1 Tax=Kribbella caucasensis TaxID=2512215 RepID=A0A4R6KG71_9ACTN|nr:Hsp70 protein [Kribbella sp. VKM Ac-2527]
MGYRLGVDLGTTYTAAAVARGGTIEAMFLGDGYAAPIPSVAFLSDDGSLVFGDVAVRRGAEHPERMKLEFKRRIGDNTNLYIGGTPVSAHVLTGELLGAVIKQVARLQGGEADEVVVTCPANWGPYRRELLDQAISISGVTAARVCTEPEAAALHFASTGRVRDGDTIAVTTWAAERSTRPYCARLEVDSRSWASRKESSSLVDSTSTMRSSRIFCRRSDCRRTTIIRS